MRKRAGALFIKDRKLFLMCENQQGFFWTPGGGLEGGESFEQALERELEEELNARLLSAELYMTIHDEAEDEEVRYFLVTLDLPPSLPANVESYWYGGADFQANATKISQRIHDKVYPRLIADNLVNSIESNVYST